MKELYGIGLGGTNVQLGRVDPTTGNVYEGTFERRALSDLGSNYGGFVTYLASKIPHGADIGICVAGVVDEDAKKILNTENSPFGNSFDLVGDLEGLVGGQISMVGDIKGETMALAREGWGDYSSGTVVLATYSTGYNANVAEDGKLISKAAREMGHGTPYHPMGDFPNIFRYVPCGCQLNNEDSGECIEPYVSASGAAKMAQMFLGDLIDSDEYCNARGNLILDRSMEREGVNYADVLNNSETRESVLNSISGRDVYEAYHTNLEQLPQKSIIAIQQRAIVDSLLGLNATFNPDYIVVKGSLAENNFDLLFNHVQEDFDARSLRGYNRPEIHCIDDDKISVKGGAADFLNKNSKK
ncbi:MAG: putative NBD/HSP70 family sugar kinase [Patescibacteria group bacterium]|jgi:predicted NBD/HSP70 family sugar kinase